MLPNLSALSLRTEPIEVGKEKKASAAKPAKETPYAKKPGQTGPNNFVEPQDLLTAELPEPPEKVVAVSPKPSPDESKLLRIYYGASWHMYVTEYDKSSVEYRKRMAEKNRRILQIRKLVGEGAIDPSNPPAALPSSSDATQVDQGGAGPSNAPPPPAAPPDAPMQDVTDPAPLPAPAAPVAPSTAPPAPPPTPFDPTYGWVYPPVPSEDELKTRFPLDYNGFRTIILPRLKVKYGENWDQGFTPAEKKERSDMEKLLYRLELWRTDTEGSKTLWIAQKKAEAEAAAAAAAGPSSASTTPNTAPATTPLTAAKADTRARALLRYWFNKEGRTWHSFDSEGNTTALHKARKKWALSKVADPNFDALNLPFPEAALWGPYDKYDEARAKFFGFGVMPEFVGPAVGLKTQLAPNTDGLDVVFYVKQKQVQYTMGQIRPIVVQTDPKRYFDDTFRLEMKENLTNLYDPFIKDLLDMGTAIMSVVGENSAYVYTEGSGRFNRTLRIPAERFRITQATPEIPNDMIVRRKRAELAYTEERAAWPKNNPHNPYLPPELTSFDDFVDSGLFNVHSLWKLIFLAPRLNREIILMRSVQAKKFLPHAYAGVSEADLTPGMSFLDTGFISATVADVDEYRTGTLSGFYNKFTQCCLQMIIVKPGTPCMPVFVRDNTAYEDEEEVVLPPLMEITFMSKFVTDPFPDSGKDNTQEIYVYQAGTAF